MGDKTYLVQKTNGEEFMITVPEEYKVTFGPAVVAQRSAIAPAYKSLEGKIPMALRFYEKNDLQRAIFTGVASFRDMSLPIKIKKTSIQQKEGYMECDGKRKATSFQAKTQEWVNPDADLSTPALPEVEGFDVDFIE